jgi:hypothetical protein
MQGLLGGEMAPVTSEIGFLEADAGTAAGHFAAWQSSLSRFGRVKFEHRRVEGDLRSILCALHPLTSIQRQRFLFVPTDSEWTAYFDNGHEGTDVFSTISVLAEDLKCRGIRAVARSDDEGGGGAVIFELYGPRQEDFLNFQRTIGVSREGHRWEFWETGASLPFEESDCYAAADVRERFTIELLERYLRKLGGIYLFDDDFYAPDRHACLVERTGRTARGVEEYPLDSCETVASGTGAT